MDIAALKTRLVALEQQITGIAAAFEHVPASIVDLPCVLNFTGPADYSRFTTGQDSDYETRVMLLRFLIARVQQGIPGEAEERVDPFIDRVREFFDARPGLIIDPAEQAMFRAGVLSDTGVARFAVAGEEFIGVEFRLQVQQFNQIGFADWN